MKLIKKLLSNHGLNYIKPCINGPVAQLVEQFPFKEWVTSSNLVGLTILCIFKIIDFVF
jgi:hypothetical protein